MCWKIAGKTFSSDLRKPCLRTGESLSPPTKIDHVHVKITYYITKTRWEVFTYIEEKSSQNSVKQNYFQSQTSFHHDKRHCSIWSLKNAVLNKIVKITDGTSVVWCVPDGLQFHCSLCSFAKCNILHRLDETIVFAMVTVCLWLEIFLSYRTFENFVLLVETGKYILLSMRNWCFTRNCNMKVYTVQFSSVSKCWVCK